MTPVVMKVSVFWDITPCSPLKFIRHFGGILKVEPTYSSETSVEFQRTTKPYIPEGRFVSLCIIIQSLKSELSTSKLLVNKYGLHVKFLMYEGKRLHSAEKAPHSSNPRLATNKALYWWLVIPHCGLQNSLGAERPPLEPLLKTFHIIVSLKWCPPREIHKVLSMDEQKHLRNILLQHFITFVIFGYFASVV
jgi:hypothetical protein